MATIALCIPAYNAAWCLPKLLKSANDQLIPFDEILVYNDCSTDNTEEIAKKFGATVITGSVNVGCSIGKNRLASICKSEWIHFHDADDDILPNFSTEINLWIENHAKRFDLLILNYNYIDYETNTILGSASIDKELLRFDAIKYTITNKLVNFGLYNRVEFLNAGGFDTDKKVLYNEDNALHQRLAIKGLKFDYLETITCVNYLHKTSMSQLNRLNCAKANFHVLAKTAGSQGEKYAQEIVSRLYACIVTLSFYQEWDYIKEALKLCKALGQPHSTTGSRIFNILTTVNPFIAVWLREKMIRIFKPKLRRDA